MFGKGAHLTGPLISHCELWRQRHGNFFSIENGPFCFCTKYVANDDFLKFLDALIPKIPFSFFTEFWVRITSEPGLSLSRIQGGPSIEPFFWEGAVARVLYRPAPPEVESRPKVWPRMWVGTDCVTHQMWAASTGRLREKGQ